jgi:hypothetical protein
VDELSTYDPFATPSDYAAWAQKSLTPADTATVAANLAAASDEIRKACEWQVWPHLTDDVLTLDGPGGRLLVLPVSIVTDIALITQDGTDLDANAYEWSTNGVIEANCWTRKRRGIIVTVSHGLVTKPNDLKLLACQLAGRAEAAARGNVNTERAGSVQRSYTVPQSGVVVGIELTDADRNKLKGYRGGYR